MVNQSQDKANDDNLKIIEQAGKLRGMMTTIGWMDVAEPILTKMIKDASGYKKEDGTWQLPEPHFSMTNDDLKWYRQGLVDYNNHLFGFFKLAEDVREMYKDKDKKDNREYVMPMKDTAYAKS